MYQSISAFIALFLFINLIGIFYRRRKGLRLNTLSCGLFGGGFSVPIDGILLEEMKILGLFNQERGRDSCGYYNGLEIRKGVDKEKIWFDYIKENGLVGNDGSNNIFIGHTRSSTIGMNSEENAHPFNIDNKLILAHNGTLKNHWTLCNTYDVNASKIFVDSMALASLLVKVGPKILNEYKGAAALMMTKPNKKNELFIYHGSSKDTEHGPEIEERPLFAMLAPHGVYISSLKNALEFIRKKDLGYEEPFMVEHNKVFKIRDGKWITKPSFVVDRGDMNVTYYTPVPTRYVQPALPYNPSSYGYHETQPYDDSYHAAANTSYSKKYERDKLTDDFKSLPISQETFPALVGKKVTTVGGRFLYFHKGRHHSYPENILADGVYRLDRKSGKILATDDVVNKDSTFYFHKGVFIKNLDDYNTITTALTNQTGTLFYKLTSKHHNFAENISEFSRYPVTNMKGEAEDIGEYLRSKWYIKSKVAGSGAGAITPIFSDRNYHFIDGKLWKITPSDKSETPIGAVVNNQQEHVKALIEKAFTPTDSVIWGEDTIKAAMRFEEIYKGFDEAVLGLGGYCMQALGYYMEDILNIVLDQEYTKQLGDAMCAEVIQEAVNTGVSIRSLLDETMIDCLEKYIEDAFINDEKRKDEDVESLTDMQMTLTKSTELYDKAFEDEDKNTDNMEDNTKMDKEFENADAAEYTREFITLTEDLHKLALKYQMLNNSDMAQVISATIFDGIKNLREEVGKTLQDNKFTKEYMEIKNSLKII